MSIINNIIKGSKWMWSLLFVVVVNMAIDVLFILQSRVNHTENAKWWLLSALIILAGPVLIYRIYQKVNLISRMAFLIFSIMICFRHVHEIISLSATDSTLLVVKMACVLFAYGAAYTIGRKDHAKEVGLQKMEEPSKETTPQASTLTTNSTNQESIDLEHSKTLKNLEKDMD